MLNSNIKMFTRKYCHTIIPQPLAQMMDSEKMLSDGVAAKVRESACVLRPGGGYVSVMEHS